MISYRKEAEKRGYKLDVNFLTSLPFCILKDGVSHSFKSPDEMIEFLKEKPMENKPMEIIVKAHGIEAYLLMENLDNGIKLMLQDGSGYHHSNYIMSYHELQRSVTSFDLGMILEDMMSSLANQIRDKQVADSEDIK